MNILSMFAFSFALITAFGSSITKNPPVGHDRKLIGHFPSSSAPNEWFHITDSPQQLFHKFSPGAFTYKWTVSPHKRTFSPLELVASKKPRSRGTKIPPVEDELSHHGGVTFPRGAFTHKSTLPEFGRNAFAPIELNKNSHPTRVPPSLQSDIYPWAPVKSSHVSKKPHGTNRPPSE